MCSEQHTYTMSHGTCGAPLRNATGHGVRFGKQASTKQRNVLSITPSNHRHPTLLATLMTCPLYGVSSLFVCVHVRGGRGAGSPHPSHTNTMLIHNRNTGSPPRWQPHLYWMVTKTSHSRSSRLKGNTIQSLKALKL